MRRFSRSRSLLLKVVLALAGITFIVVTSKAQQSNRDTTALDSQVSVPLVSRTAHMRTPTPTAEPSPALTAVPRLGVQTGDASSNTMSLAMSAGAKWTRVTVVWSQIEQTPGIYSFGGVDSLLAAAAGAGLTTIVEIRGNPVWVASTSCGPIDRPGGIDAFGSFIRATVERYSQSPYYVKHWELYNEADNRNVGLGAFVGGCWGDHPAEYVAMLQAARRAMNQVDTSARIVLGGLARDVYPSETDNWFNVNFPSLILDAGGAAYIDVMNIHYFSTQGPNWSSYGQDIAGKVEGLRQVMRTRNVSKPVLVTELNWTQGFPGRWETWTPAQVSEFAEMQARYLPKAFARGLAIDLYAMTWFLLQDWPGADLPYGLYDLNGQARPAYYAFKTAAGEFGQATYLRALTASDIGGASKVEGYVFTYGDEERWVLWATGNQVTISIPGRATTAKDKLGQTISLGGGRSPSSYQLTESPIFVRLNAS